VARIGPMDSTPVPIEVEGIRCRYCLPRGWALHGLKANPCRDPKEPPPGEFLESRQSFPLECPPAPWRAHTGGSRHRPLIRAGVYGRDYYW
jgi:hypothetical protein